MPQKIMPIGIYQGQPLKTIPRAYFEDLLRTTITDDVRDLVTDEIIRRIEHEEAIRKKRRRGNGA